MQTVRRIYLYFMAAVSLVMLAVGVGNLLDLAFTQVWVGLGGSTVAVGDPASVRQQVSLFTALVVPALPIWLLHWWLAQRALTGPSAADERRSPVRALFLTLALAISLTVALFAAGTVIVSLIVWLASPTQARAATELPGALAAALVAGAIWLYHQSVRRSDQAAGRLSDSAVWLPRLYLYYAAGLGLVRLLFGATDLLSLISQLALGSPATGGPEPWWAVPLAAGIAQVLLGGLVWLVHWRYAQHLIAAPDWRAASEQQSILRRVYLYLIVLISVAVTLTALSSSLDNLLRLLLGVPRASGAFEQARLIIEPPLGVVPFVLSWWFHRRQIIAEAQLYAEAPYQATVRRLYTYAVALAGLIFSAVGLALVIGLLIDLLTGAGGRPVGADSATWWRANLSQYIALTLIGTAVWLWQWSSAQRRRLAEPTAERDATTRRIYLFVVLAGTLIALLGGLAVIIYRIFNVLLGVPGGNLMADISAALGTTLVAAPLLAYHALALRADLAERSEVAGRQRSLKLLLIGPPEADLEAQVATLRAQLPAGYRLLSPDASQSAGAAD